LCPESWSCSISWSRTRSWPRMCHQVAAGGDKRTTKRNCCWVSFVYSAGEFELIKWISWRASRDSFIGVKETKQKKDVVIEPQIEAQKKHEKVEEIRFPSLNQEGQEEERMVSLFWQFVCQTETKCVNTVVSSRKLETELPKCVNTWWESSRWSQVAGSVFGVFPANDFFSKKEEKKVEIDQTSLLMKKNR